MRQCELKPEGLLKVLEEHRVLLESQGVKPLGVEHDVAAPARWQQAGHALAIILVTIDLIKAGHVDRANRWLGFAQGIMFCLGLFNTDELRLLNEGTYDPQFRITQSQVPLRLGKLRID